jgi:uncharacterized membrane protein
MSRRLLLTLSSSVAVVIVVACGTTPQPDTLGSVDIGFPVRDAGPRPVDCTTVAPTSCPDPAPTYGDIEPILRQHCIGCHAGQPNGPWPLTDYKHVADWADDIRADMLSCSMPPADAGTTITIAEREELLQWIRCGMPK